MYFKNILNKKFLTLTDVYEIDSIFDYNFKNDTLYKLSYVKKFDTEFINNFELTTEYFSLDDTKYPDNALKIDLKRGTYRISYISGGLFNTETKELNNCIMSSKGKIEFSNNFELSDDDKNNISSENFNEIFENYSNKNFDNYFDFKITSASKFHIWINSENIIGNILFKINKIDKKEINENEFEQLFDSSDVPSLYISNNSIYNVAIDELLEDEITKPKYKYPTGTYQVILSNNVKKDGDIDSLIQIQSSIKKTYKFDQNNKLTSLDKIDIPYDVNPLNFYFMLGKIELIVFIDFINDKYYYYPNSYAECFMNLYLPDTKFEKIEETTNYVKFKLTEFKHISYNFNDKSEIINNFSKWLNINEDEIYHDEYELYYYVKSHRLDSTYFSELIPKYINFDEFFTYIKLNISCKAYDDVSVKVDNEDILLDYEIVQYQEDENNVPISGGLWEVVNEKPNEFNYITWTHPTKWINTNNENVLMGYINGTGYIKISKNRFKNLFNVDLNYITYGNFTTEQFKSLKLNDPIISPYERFQYWMNLKV